MSTTPTLADDLLSAYGALLQRRRRQRRLVRTTAVAAVSAFAVAGAAFATAALLGWPAPEHVKRDIAAVDRGLPADLRLNPDVEHARAVAATASATLYAAKLRGGGSCSELVTAGERGRGATCTTGVQLASRPLDVTLPFDDGAGPDAPIVIGGRINADAAMKLEARYADGSTEEIRLGDERYFLFEVPAARRASVHVAGIELVARSASGATVADEHVPPDWDDPAVPDERSPLYVGTRSDESDFTKVYGLEGHVSAGGAARLELDYGDGAHVTIPIRRDGSFDYAVPAGRAADFMQPRTVIARDAEGRAIATATVAAVAYWRARDRGR